MTVTIRSSVAPPTRARIAVCVAAAIACIPYACLKIAWIAGSTVGIADAETADTMGGAEFRAANAVTLGLELGAVAVVAALTFTWGRRIPAPLVLMPLWVGAGLLAPVVIGLPAGLLVQAFVGGSPAPDANGLHGWIYAMVYGGFILQAPLLLAAFVLHAKARWPWVFRARGCDAGPGTTPALQRLVAGFALAGTGLYAVAHAGWAATGGLGGPTGFETAAQRTFLLVDGVLPLVGAFGVLVLVRRGGTRLLPAAVAAWIGSGTAFASTLMASKDESQVEAVLQSIGGMSGVAMAITGLLVLLDARESAAQPLR